MRLSSPSNVTAASIRVLKRRVFSSAPGRTTIVFGNPLRPGADENTRRFNTRIESAVALLGDESLTDYWTSRRNRAIGANPKLTGPEYNGWRREWALTEQRQLGDMGIRRRQKRRWPDLG